MRLPKPDSTHIVPAILALFLLAALAGWGANFITTWMWFLSEGYAGVFLRGIVLRAATGGVFAALVFMILAGNLLWAVNRTREDGARVHPLIAQTPLALLPRRRIILRVAGVLCGVIAALFGLGTSAWWSDAVMWLFGSPFGHVEPVLRRDAAFYVFTLPMLLHMRNLLAGVTVLSALMCAGVYAVRGAVGMTVVLRGNQVIARRPRLAPEARRHLAAHLASLLVLGGLSLHLSRFEMLYAGGDLLTGPGYKDVYGALPLRFLSAVALAAGGLVIYHAVLRQAAARIIWAGAAILVLLLAAWIYPGLLQRFSVLPNELNREKEFIGHHIAATRLAFGLDRVEERSLSGQSTLTRADIEANRQTLQNIRLWDHEPLLETFGQVQEIRTYYKFNSVDNDRYMIGGEPRQTMLSPREMVIKDLPNRTWVNERLSYTHGYGVAMGPVNQVDPEGLPELFIKDLPPVVAHPELAITRPEIYFGELTHEPVFVRTRANEFDYPSGEENVFANYSGDGGMPIGSLWRRLLFAIRHSDIKILLTTDLTRESRILIHRRVADRIEKIAPFLSYDRDPYMVIHEGRLVWIMDAYTGTDRFPYSARLSTIGNYIRNSVKVTLDAYTGRMAFYLADPDDPIARAWAAVFPGLLRPLDEMPSGLRAHLRHPEDLFEIQAHIFGTYHMTDPQMFYNREDEWQVPKMPLPNAGGVPGDQPMKPYYTIMRLPGEERAEFIQMLPFTPHGKDNLAAWMAARSDPGHLGELVVYRFPKERLVFGPRQILSRINQDDAIAPQLTLWNQQGSNVVLGTLLVIPIQESLIYVQPLYLKAEKGKIPELKRVMVGYESQIVMASGLDEALRMIFPESGGALPPEGAPGPGPREVSGEGSGAGDLAALARQAREAMEAARAAAASGDWARHGEELGRVQKLVIEMERLTAPQAGAPQ